MLILVQSVRRSSYLGPVYTSREIAEAVLRSWMRLARPGETGFVVRDAGVPAGEVEVSA